MMVPEGLVRVPPQPGGYKTDELLYEVGTNDIELFIWGNKLCLEQNF